MYLSHSMNIAIDQFVSSGEDIQFVSVGEASKVSILCLKNNVIKIVQSYGRISLWNECYIIKLILLIKMYYVIFVDNPCWSIAIVL